MASSSTSLGGGFTLVFNGNLAFPYFSIQGPAGAVTGRNDISLSNLSRITVEDWTPGNQLLTFERGGQVVAPTGVMSTLVAALGPAAQSLIDQAKTAQTTTTPPAPAPEPEPSPPAPKPVVTETENQVITRTNGVDVVVDKAPVVTETETSVTTRVGGVDIVVDKPPVTTDPSQAALPLGDDIDDIYDPNLTPEQIASLSPGDQRAREAFLAEEAAGGNVGEITDGEIVVIGERIRPDAFKPRTDWRVRLALSDDPSVNYLYKADNPGILNPLNATNGVIFPYTPTISVNYAANYNPTELVHSNYKVYQYSSSSIDTVTITGDFTAQDEYEANYLLAVIHFFRSATKMFYGQDESPRRGTPPPLCYIYGMGSYQFAGQPLAISQFSYNLPNNVDYITTSTGEDQAPSATTQPPRMAGTGVARGGVLPPPQFTPISEPGTISRVPSKIQLSVTCVPMMNRNAVSNVFSFEEYATGRLLNGIGKRFGGFW